MSFIVLRFVVGAMIAGIYPVGIRITASWATADPGVLVGLLVAASTWRRSETWIGAALCWALRAKPVKHRRMAAKARGQVRAQAQRTCGRRGLPSGCAGARAPATFARPLAATTRRYHGRGQDETCMLARMVTLKRFFA